MIRHPPWRALPLAALLLWAPLPFGSVTSTASAALLLGALASAVLALWTARAPYPPRAAIAAATALALLAFGGWLQSLAWPEGLVGWVSPRHLELATSAREVAGVTAKSSGVPLTLAPDTSRAAALDWLIPAAGLAAAAWLGSSRRVRRLLAGALLLAAVAQVTLAVEQWVSRSDTLWGRPLPATGSRLHGSFVNPNHFALALEIALAVTFAWGWWAARRTLQEGSSAERRLVALGPPVLVGLLLAGALVLTGSRAGLLAMAVAFGAQTLWVTGRREHKWLLGAALVGLVGAVALVSLVGFEGAFARLLATPLDEVGGNGRLRAAAATLRLWSEFPWTGTGLGTFRAGFPLVQPAALPGLWRHAHCDWAELVATTGLLGLGVGLTGLVLLLRRVSSVLRRGERSEDRAAGLAALGAAIAVGLHSFADFGLTMPANALAIAVVLGAAAAAPTTDAPKPASAP